MSALRSSRMALGLRRSIARRSTQANYAYAASALCEYLPSLIYAGNASEQRSFHYIRAVLTQEQLSWFEAESWLNLALLACQCEPAVRYSINALGALFQAKVESANARQLTSESTTEKGQAHLTFSLLQYTRAVGLLANGLSSDQPTEQTALIICLLFVWLELVQRRLDAALKHLQSGLKILQSLSSVNRLHTVNSSLCRAFARLHAQARLHSSPTSSFNREAPNICVDSFSELPATFESIAEDRQYLDRISEAAYCLCRQLKGAPGSSKLEDAIPRTVSGDPWMQIESLRLSPHKWQRKYKAFVAQAEARADARQACAIALLELQDIGLHVLLDERGSEMVYEKHQSLLERSLSVAESLLRLMQRNGTFQLSLDAGLIAPLFLLALKCRAVSMRRKAIALLSLAPEQEGLWRRDSVIAVTTWKLRMEHDNGKGQLLDHVPPAEARVHMERTATVLLGGRMTTVLQFKKGDISSASMEWQEEQIDLLAKMGDML